MCSCTYHLDWQTFWATLKTDGKTLKLIPVALYAISFCIWNLPHFSGFSFRLDHFIGNKIRKLISRKVLDTKLSISIALTLLMLQLSTGLSPESFWTKNLFPCVRCYSVTNNWWLTVILLAFTFKIPLKPLFKPNLKFLFNHLDPIIDILFKISSPVTINLLSCLLGFPLNNHKLYKSGLVFDCLFVLQHLPSIFEILL